MDAPISPAVSERANFFTGDMGMVYCIHAAVWHRWMTPGCRGAYNDFNR